LSILLIRRWAYVATGEVTALEHELRDDTVESRASISKALLAGAESTEIFGSLGDDIIVEGKVDATRLFWKQRLVSCVQAGGGVKSHDDVNKQHNVEAEPPTLSGKHVCIASR
jgi:hypothetical protein